MAGQSVTGEFVERFLKTCGWLADLPKAGKDRPELGIRRLRSYPVHPYIVFYRPMAFGIQITRVLHQRMDAKQEFARRRKGRGKARAAQARKRKAG